MKRSQIKQPRTAKPRIILFGTYAEHNAGDDYLLAVQVKQFLNRIPDVHLIILTCDRAETRRLLEREGLWNNHITLLYSGRHGIREPGAPWYRSVHWFWQNIRETAKANFLLIGPGNQLQDVTRRMRVLFFISRAVLAWFTRTPYAYFGIGFYKIKSRFCRRMLKLTARKAAFVSTRDEGGAQRIRELGISASKVFSLRDITFCHHWQSPDTISPEHPGKPLIGFSCRIFLPTVFPSDVAENFYHSLASLLAAIHRELGAELLFIPFYRSSAFHDGVALDHLQSRAELKEVPVKIHQWDTLASLREGIAACDAFVGVRYHSMLLSVQSGTPVLGISYGHKTRRFMEEVSLGDDVVIVESATPDRLIAKWHELWENRATRSLQYRKICESSRALAEKHIDLVVQHISNHE